MMTSMAMTAVVLVSWLAGKSLAIRVLRRRAGFFLYAIRRSAGVAAREHAPQHGGTSIGVLFGAQALGSSIGPPPRRAGRGQLRF